MLQSAICRDPDPNQRYSRWSDAWSSSTCMFCLGKACRLGQCLYTFYPDPELDKLWKVPVLTRMSLRGLYDE